MYIFVHDGLPNIDKISGDFLLVSGDSSTFEGVSMYKKIIIISGKRRRGYKKKSYGRRRRY